MHPSKIGARIISFVDSIGCKDDAELSVKISDNAAAIDSNGSISSSEKRRDGPMLVVS
jgi:hypothetical protein